MGRVQIIPTSNTLQGEPHQMAMQFCQQVLHQLLMELVAREGAHAVVGFYAGLVTNIALDMNGALGTKHAEHILRAALDKVQKAKPEPEFYNRQEG